MHEPQTTARTAIVTTALANASGHLGEDEIDALADLVLASADLAIKTGHPMLDWADYREADL